MSNTTTKAPKLFTIPAGTRSAICRGEDCRKSIYFVMNPETGRMIPLDPDVEGGKRPSETKDVGQLDMLSGDEAPVYDGKGVSHFLTCLNADDFSRSPR